MAGGPQQPSLSFGSPTLCSLPKGPALIKQHPYAVWYVVIPFAVLLLAQVFWPTQPKTSIVPYSEFQMLLREGKISEVGVANRSITATLKSPEANGVSKIFTERVDPEIAKDLTEAGVKYSQVTESTWIWDVLSWVVPTLLFVGLWRFILSPAVNKRGGLMSLGRSKAKVYVEKDIKVTFADVAGVDEAKDELQEVVSFLKDPKTFGRLGAHVPKGILLVGPPGTGKTLLARAVAGESGVPFFSINGSEFVELFVGMGAARVRDLFEQARLAAPCIIFIDELDALGKARGLTGAGGSNDEKEQTLNQLLSELDGFNPAVGVVLLAATNRPEILDPALLRAGRFDRHIVVDRPDKLGRVAILKVHLKKITLAPDIDPAAIAAMTPGFTGADLANLVNEAAMLATRRNESAVTLDDFTRAIERIIAGPEKRNRLLNVHERKTVAAHEMGHAIVAMALSGSDPVQKISIIPRGIGALGYTIQRPIEDRYLMTKPELESKMAVLLGGRAAELLTFGVVSTGASDDLQKATDIARAMVVRYGMDAGVGQAVFAAEQSPFLGQQSMAMERMNISEETASKIDRAIRELVEAAFAQASAVLKIRKRILDEGAARLLEKETLNEADLDDLRKQAAVGAVVERVKVTLAV